MPRFFFVVETACRALSRTANATGALRRPNFPWRQGYAAQRCRRGTDALSHDPTGLAFSASRERRTFTNHALPTTWAKSRNFPTPGRSTAGFLRVGVSIRGAPVAPLSMGARYEVGIDFELGGYPIVSRVTFLRAVLPKNVYYPIRNRDFNAWRKKFNRGGDMMLYSEPKKVKLAKPIVLTLDRICSDLE